MNSENDRSSYAIKKNTKRQAWELGKGSDMEKQLIKTGRLVVVHEAHRNAGWGAEVAAMVAEEAFRYLDAPPMRLGMKACPLPFNVGLENAATPQVADIVEAARRVCYR